MPSDTEIIASVINYQHNVNKKIKLINILSF